MSKGEIFIGVNALIFRENKILLQLRQNSAGAGNWALPGGHVEFREKFSTALIREMREELGLNLIDENVKFAALFDEPRKNLPDDHHVQVGFFAKIGEQNPRILEPDKCAKIAWFSLDDLPKNFWEAHQGLINLVRNGEIYPENRDKI